MARLGFEPTISRSEIDRAKHYSIGYLFEMKQIYLCYIHCNETKSESWPVKISVRVLPEFSLNVLTLRAYCPNDILCL